MTALAIFFALSPAGHAQDNHNDDDQEPAANPGRPTIATPATLTPVGYLQFETGVLSAKHSPEFSSTLGLNEVIKFSVHPRLELLLSSEPSARSRVGHAVETDAGDLSIGAQAVIRPGEGPKPTLSASYFRQVYEGPAPNLDLGSPQQSLLLLASADVKGFHYDANGFFNEIVENAVRRLQFGQTLSISHPIAGRYGVTGEIWHFTQPFLHAHAAGSLWCVAYTARRNLVLDLGFDRGLTATSTRWQVFAGVTYLLPHRLWPFAR